MTFHTDSTQRNPKRHLLWRPPHQILQGLLQPLLQRLSRTCGQHITTSHLLHQLQT